ncbi:MAG: bifunctional 5,10-methylene-tetrahydrofolate dehydrogenase/5,10-methylene-tetrahydrofolate cyclohydrolase [Verrucomicrobia bacterium 21-51-4]|nr:MAG: bifunctional 5,10-methylene-tetrahydrofolate dehydrogenase/5,10-methylene-tetrahydrofolate cyclohydrolase [Verrucomicrobia bacterium 21-51-4]HQU08892.1 tetrahydrofolate dehydrogenase/cyclohydrolase catalytic domain-containing protein [Opitutales bacterium]
MVSPTFPDKFIDGRAIADAVLAQLGSELSKLPAGAPRPTVAFVRVGEDPASIAYVGRKQRVAQELGFVSILKVFPESITEAELIAQIQLLGEDPAIHGILVQSPLPARIDPISVYSAVPPHKDVDGFHPVNLGKLIYGDPSGFIPCTPLGLQELLKRSQIETSGKHIVILGRGLIVGKPAALVFLQKQAWANATVTVCHSATTDLAKITASADILIAAIGSPLMVGPTMLKAGCVVIDVGINRVDDPTTASGYRLVGDVDCEQVLPIVSRITPVPGGVGPLTVAMLMRNSWKAYCTQTKFS